MSKVIIVGGGPAGLTVARRLNQLCRPFILLDSKDRGKAALAPGNRGLGLWGRSQAVLHALGLRNLLTHETESVYNPAAAYRSRDGTWLSRCSASNLENPRRVITLREPNLLAHLREGLPESAILSGPGARVERVEQNENRVRVHLAGDRCIEGSVLVAADGTMSGIRSALFPREPSPIAGPITFSGVIDDGTCRLQGKSVLEPYETLSRGRRFAAVPLPGNAFFWFATVPSNFFSSSAAAALSEESGARDELWSELASMFSDWHEPIPAILREATCSTNSSSVRIERVHAVPASQPWFKERVVLVGDAAHGMGHNLAQGASAAIEGAFLLASCLDRQACASGIDEWPLSASAATRAFEAFAAAHTSRVQNCRRLTFMTDVLARPEGPVVEAARNGILRSVPKNVNGWIFDRCLEYSLGDLPHGVRDRWPLGRKIPHEHGQILATQETVLATAQGNWRLTRRGCGELRLDVLFGRAEMYVEERVLTREETQHFLALSSGDADGCRLLYLADLANSMRLLVSSN